MDFPRNDTTFFGRWKKEGHRADIQAQKIMQCLSCKEDHERRNYPMRKKLRSYRVEGVTDNNLWEWFEGVCDNQSRCWGPKIRYWTVLKSASEEWVFQTHTSDANEPNRLSLLDELRKALNFSFLILALPLLLDT